MALINNVYVFVDSEDIGRSSSIPQHPVEKGLPITDNVKNNPFELSISGKIVDTKNSTAAQKLAYIEKLRTGGSLITYKGRNAVGNFMITSFSTSHPNTNWGGMDFSMELVQVRIAKSAYDATKQKKQQQTEVKKNPTLTVGSIVVFTGGAVYVSSDAKNAAANRGRSTCKITKISTKSWSIHQYHLISTDGKKVYGWVDKANIEGTGATTTSATTNGGTIQPVQVESKKFTVLNISFEAVGVMTGVFPICEVGSAHLDNNTFIVGGKEWYICSYNNNYCFPREYIKIRRATNAKGLNVNQYYFPKGTPRYRKK